MNKNKIILIGLILFGMIINMACNNDDDEMVTDKVVEKHKEEILGKWIQVNPIYLGGDTLIFTEDGRLIRIFKTLNDTLEIEEYYRIQSAVSIEVQRDWDTTFKSFSYKFSTEYDTLTIEEYIETGAPFGGNIDLILKYLTI